MDENLLGVKENRCIHSSQYSFLLCFNHCSRLQSTKTLGENPVMNILKMLLCITTYKVLDRWVSSGELILFGNTQHLCDNLFVIYLYTVNLYTSKMPCFSKFCCSFVNLSDLLPSWLPDEVLNFTGWIFAKPKGVTLYFWSCDDWNKGHS